MAVLHSVRAAQGARLGRFDLKRVLGEGAQAVVWLAFDPRLEREVAIKVMRSDAASGTGDVNDWLREARSVSRLSHPNIVQVFEADVHDGSPCLVFEYVPGQTLAQLARTRVREHGAMPPREAVSLMLGVLDALSAAHAAGVVHRDLKPSNILVDAGGRPRVMDFGIAARVQDAGDATQIVGTPWYMSPEAAQGGAAAPAMDVFAAGLVLAELLTGSRLVSDRDPYRAIARIAHTDLELPAIAQGDDTLRAVVLRALARDPVQRHPSAQGFRDALQRWLAPAAPALVAAPGPGSAGSGTLEFLLRRMRHKSDFPAMSDAIARIQRMANSDTDSVGQLSNEILRDVALTQKLLRWVNTAAYRHAGGGSISTVSRAVALIGFAGIRNMALSLVLLEHMHDKEHAGLLREEFLRSLMAGVLAGEMCPLAREGEEAFIGAMFQNLGRLLTGYYFPEEAREICARLEPQTTDGREPPGEAAASTAVLGLSYEDLGIGVAKAWGLPDSLQRCMRPPPGEPPARVPRDAGERIRWVASAANAVADVLLNTPPEEAAAGVAAACERYAGAIGVSARDIERATAQARQQLSQMADAMNLHVPPGAASRRLLEAPADAAPADDPEDSLTGHALQATMPLAPADAPTVALPMRTAGVPQDELPARDAAASMLAAGIQDITNTMVAENFRLNEVLRMILETMFRALHFRRVVFCLRDVKSGMLSGRFGLGEGADLTAAAFKVPMQGGTDLFAAVCRKGVDTLISDARASNIATRLPPWFRESIDAPAFLLLPLLLKGAPFGLIYADKASPGGIELDEKELSLLRTLRNQAVMAFRQSG